MIAAGVGVVIVIFGFVLPSVIDYESVFDVLKNLDPIDYVIMIGAGLLLCVPATASSLPAGYGFAPGDVGMGCVNGGFHHDLTAVPITPGGIGIAEVVYI